MGRRWGSQVNKNNQVNNNKAAIEDAAAIQHETLEAIERMRQQASEAETIGVTTLAELQEQRRQLDRVMEENERVAAGLDKTTQLQDKMSRWALNFNRGAAKRDVQIAEEAERQRKELYEERMQKRLSDNSSPTPPSSSSTVDTVESTESGPVITKHGQSAFVIKRKKNKNANAAKAKGLTYGLDKKGLDDETGKDLDRLADTDAVIDDHLEELGDQLDGLLDLTKCMNAEVKVQNRQLNEVDSQVDRNNQKQKIVNGRARRFLDGKKKENADTELKPKLWGIF